jgi:hypothetical protein
MRKLRLFHECDGKHAVGYCFQACMYVKNTYLIFAAQSDNSKHDEFVKKTQKCHADQFLRGKLPIDRERTDS